MESIIRKNDNDEETEKCELESKIKYVKKKKTEELEKKDEKDY